MRVIFELFKETAGTLRYAEVTSPGEEARVRTVYITKRAAAELGNPARLLVTIDAAGVAEAPEPAQATA